MVRPDLIQVRLKNLIGTTMTASQARALFSLDEDIPAAFELTTAQWSRTLYRLGRQYFQRHRRVLWFVYENPPRTLLAIHPLLRRSLEHQPPAIPDPELIPDEAGIQAILDLAS